MNKPPYGTQIRELNPLEIFKVSAQDNPNLTVKINAGTYIVGSGTIVEYNGGNSPILTRPVSGFLWLLVCLGPNANIVVTNNASNPPAIPKNHLGLAIIYQRSSDTTITNDMIFDIRPIYANTTYALPHSELTGNTAANCHPINSIIDLQTALDAKLAITENVNNLADKADIDGTTESSFTLNKSLTGSPTENSQFVIERGSEANVSFRYNETNNKWQFTNDGSEFFDFSNLGSVDYASDSVIGKTALSVDPVDAETPIAVGDNDPRILAVVLKAPLASPTFTGTVSGITKAMVGLTNVNDTSDANKPVSTATTTQLNLKAPIASPTFTGTVNGITKAMVGLNLVDNIADTAKPVSTPQLTALNLKENSANKGAVNGYCPLDSSTKIASTYLPDSLVGSLVFQGAWNATTNTPTMAAASSGNKGEYFIVSVAGTTTINGCSSWAIGDWIISNGTVWSKITKTNDVTSINTRVGAITLSKVDVGLINVDDTTDLLKPLSTATINALALKANIASPTFTGTVGGITKAMVGLTSVDDTSDANKPVSTATTTQLNLKAPIASPTFTGTVAGITKAMVGLTSVDDTADSAKPVSSTQQIALDLKANKESPTFTGTVGGITKAMVGLTNVNNTSDVNKPVSNAQQAALDLKANLQTGITGTFVISGTTYTITEGIITAITPA